jgi:hypothetical protein
MAEKPTMVGMAVESSRMAASLSSMDMAKRSKDRVKR